jgi:type IV pilus assembly protein PilY1
MNFNKAIAIATLITFNLQIISSAAYAAPTALADRPVGATGSGNVPANVLFTPSVEFPTAVSQAHLGGFDPGFEYIGYFDAYKCYTYSPSAQYFEPTSYTIGTSVSAGKLVKTGSRFCSGQWSGSFLNWATMQTIDTFRMTLTGGDRRIDTNSLTVVQKAFASGQGGAGNFNTKTLNGSTNISNVTPYNWSTLSVRIQGLGRNMRVHEDAAIAESDQLNDGEVEMAVAVRVCKPNIVGGLSLAEDNCTAYPAGTLKPTGLIQNNESRMRYGVVSYLNDSTTARDGGVLRARMKSVGPTTTLTTGATTTNAATEWDPNTGIFTINPDIADATASGVPNSGVINYLNKFGASGSYKSYDNVSEMYYTALRYLRNVGPVTEYQNNLTATHKDGFPVIANWDDPIQYQCQKNFTIGIGDVNTWTDRNVPGGDNIYGAEPAVPAQVAGDLPNLNAYAWTDLVGANEGVSNLAGKNGGCCSASYFISGLAYWAKTQDIRPDIPGDQNVDFYWIDVLEYQNYKHKNLYWLAAKYGGFKDLNGNGKPDGNPEWRETNNRLNWGNTTYDLPDNYFVASNPVAMADGLKRAFNSISSKISRASGLTVDTAEITGAGSEGFLPTYNPANWTGDLKAYRVSATSTGEVSTSLAWSAQTLLETQASGTGWNSLRSIVSGKYNGTTFSAGSFRYANLTTAQQAALNSDTNLVNFIRGDRSLEGTTFRTRGKLLGSIVNTDPVVVGPPGASYDDSTNPGYTAFKQANLTRTPVAYVGANDGMLHAFNGALTGTGAGREMWAYVPAALLNAGTNGNPNGLVNFASPTYAHKYLVDGQIRVQDVDFAAAGNPTGSGNWKTLLVAGLGKGGRSYVGIDVTNPNAMTTESNVASKVLWEFTDPDMGYSYGKASIFKTERYGWVVAVASGYGTPTGNSYVYLLNPQTGAIIQKILVGTGTLNNPAGLAHIGGYVPELGTHVADAIYGGDLLGRVWRIDLKAALGTYPAAQIATLTTSGGQAQPVTAPVEVQAAKGTQERFVFIGTGRYLDDTDITLNQRQSLYAILDGTRYAPALTATPPLPANAQRSNLQVLTDPNVGITLAANQSGWVYDLPNGINGANERSTIAPIAFGSQIAFASNTPASNPCATGGEGRLYVLAFKTGRTQINKTALVVPSPIFSTKIVRTGNKLKVIATTGGSDGVSVLPAGCGADICQEGIRDVTPNRIQRLNAREIRPQ